MLIENEDLVESIKEGQIKHDDTLELGMESEGIDANDESDINSVDEDFDLEELVQIESKAGSKPFGEPGVLTIVNSPKNGKCFYFAPDPIKEIGDPATLQIALLPKGIVVAEQIPGASEKFPVKKNGAKKVVYCGKLVEEVAKKFNIDYSGGRVCRTFQTVIFKELKGIKVAIYRLV